MATIQPLSGGDGITGESGQDSRDKINLSILEANKVVDKADKAITVEVKGGSYTLLESDNGKLIQVSAAATITMPAGLSSGFNCNVEKTGTGNVLFTSGAGALFISKQSYNQLITRYEKCEVLHAGADTFTIYGLESDSTAPPGGGDDDDLVQPLELLAATGAQTLIVTGGYAINTITLDHVDSDPSVTIKLGVNIGDDSIMKEKTLSSSDEFRHISRNFIPAQGFGNDWTIHLTTSLDGEIDVFIQTIKVK